MSKSIRRCLLALLVGSPLVVFAAELSGDDMRSLDGQVQEVKSDVLSIASELNTLEERLLFPSHTQVSIFVSLAEDENFRLDAIELEIDGELATHHIYSFKELDALQSGGVQRLYTGNLTTGNHQLSVRMIGKLKSGKEFSESGVFTINKGIKPSAVGIALESPGLGSGSIRVGDW